MFAILNSFVKHFSLKDLVDISAVAILIYQFIMIVRGTRAASIMVGVGALGILFSIGMTYKLYVLNWILENFFQSFFVIVVILFQEQVRTALANFGLRGSNIFGTKDKRDPEILDEVIDAAMKMSSKKIGALIVFEREQGLLNFINTGTRLDSALHADLIFSIFESSSSMHDGAVVISGNRISAAGCYLPLTKKGDLDRELGTRHRAALGLSEVTDAVVVIVSEERGDIKIANRGKFIKITSMTQFRLELGKTFGEERVIAEVVESGG